MGWLQRVQSMLKSPALRPLLPRKVLRHLIVEHDFAVGSRVLDVGCGRGELVTFLSELGFDTVGLDESPESVAAAREAAPQLDYRCGRPHEIARIHRHCYDLVLIRGLEVYRDNLFSPSAFSATAQLLSCIRPGGLLAFVVSYRAETADRLERHGIACYRNHLGVFPGTHETTPFSDYLSTETWWPFLVGGARPGFLEAALRIPSTPIAANEWLRWAGDAAARHERPCCFRYCTGDPSAGRSAA